MSLEEYLLECIVREKSIIEELLTIDNKIQKTNYTYSFLLEKIRNLSGLNLIFDKPYDFITDGEPDTVYNVLLSCPFVNRIHINRSFVAINKWLVERTKEYYQEKNVENPLFLDVENGYNNYVENDVGIILYGFSEFVNGIEEIFQDKSIAVIKK